MAKDKTPNKENAPEEAGQQLTLPGFEDLGENDRTAIADISQLKEVTNGTETLTAGDLAAVLDFVQTYFPDESETKRFASYLKQIEANNPEFIQNWIDYKAAIAELKPYTGEELKKPQYQGKTFEQLQFEAEHAEPKPGEDQSEELKLFNKLLAAAGKKAETITKQIEGRKRTAALKEKAAALDSLTHIGSHLTLQSFRGVEKKQRIYRTTTELQASDFDESGMLINPTATAELAEINSQISELLFSIYGYAVNLREEPLTDSNLVQRISAAELADKIAPDWRNKLPDGADETTRQQARSIALEKIFTEATGYIFNTSDGGRWQLFNFIGYDKPTDTFLISAPGIHHELSIVQREYFALRAAADQKIAIGKKPTNQEAKPMELNELLEMTCYNLDRAVFEIMYFFTNRVLQYGNQPTPYRAKYQYIINYCPTLKRNIANIEADKGRKNRPQLINTELRKFEQASRYLLDRRYSSVTEKYNNVAFTPTAAKGKGYLKAPTKTTLQDIVTLSWQKK